MSTFTIYAIPNCQYCIMAKNLLDEKQKSYSYYVIRDENLRKQLSARYNCTTAPIILINDEFLGGYSELKNLIGG